MLNQGFRGCQQSLGFLVRQEWVEGLQLLDGRVYGGGRHGRWVNSGAPEGGFEASGGGLRKRDATVMWSRHRLSLKSGGRSCSTIGVGILQILRSRVIDHQTTASPSL